MHGQRHARLARVGEVETTDAVCADLVHVGNGPERIHKRLVLLVHTERGVGLCVAELEARVENDTVEGTHAEPRPRRHLEGVHFMQHVHDGHEFAVPVRCAPRDGLIDHRVCSREQLDLLLDADGLSVIFVALLLEEGVVRVAVADGSTNEHVVQ